MLDCMDCKNFRTEKIYTQNGSYRIGHCPVFGKKLYWDEDLKVYNYADNCLAYQHYQEED